EQGMRPVKNWREVLATFETVKPHFASVLRQVRAALTAEGKLCLTIKRDVMGDMMLRDEATMKLLLSLTSEGDPTCNPTLGYAVIDMAPQGDSDPFSF
ncbi:MAG: hypothetical protein J6R42_04610, partial [Clostridia bacterium]|nr:hypothetical protein [Clostridia bacterium]